VRHVPTGGGLSLTPKVLVAVGVIALLVGLILPAVQRARGRAAGARCENNRRQIGLTYRAYHTGHGFFPSGEWDWSTPPYYVSGVLAVGKD
jgi:type II secretory pathway pseudopilin PulG